MKGFRVMTNADQSLALRAYEDNGVALDTYASAWLAEYFLSRHPARAALDRSVHGGAIAIAMAGVIWFLVAAWVGFAFGEAPLSIAVVWVTVLVYFAGIVGGGAVAARHQGEGPHRSFRDFLGGEVETGGGTISGRAALVQIVMLPLLLSGMMTVLASFWLFIR